MGGLGGCLAGVAGSLTGCTSAATKGSGQVAAGSVAARPSPSTSSSPAPGAGRVGRELSALESGFGGRLGAYAIDTASGAFVGYRVDEKFLMCSTHKVLAVSAVLDLRRRRPGLLDTLIRYGQSDVLAYAPVTSQHVATGMTVSALCEAAITRSDNTAANLLVRLVGGPAAVTGYVRGLGDQVTRVDRVEPEVNVASGDLDTSTPAALAADLRVLATGEALDPAGRDLLIGWLKANTTGDRAVRAGVPAGWPVGDKTGGGAQGELNDVAVVWPPGLAPLVVAVFTVPTDPKSTAGNAAMAGAARSMIGALVPGAVSPTS